MTYRLTLWNQILELYPAYNPAHTIEFGIIDAGAIFYFYQTTSKRLYYRRNIGKAIQFFTPTISYRGHK